MLPRLKWQKELAENPESARLAVMGAGAIGDPAFIPWLIEQMKVPEVARVAGESFTMITGVDIAYEDLEGEWPEGFEPGPNEDPDDENVEMDPDENLPWPDPELIQKWWNNHRRTFRMVPVISSESRSRKNGCSKFYGSVDSANAQRLRWTGSKTTRSASLRSPCSRLSPAANAWSQSNPVTAATSGRQSSVIVTQPYLSFSLLARFHVAHQQLGKPKKVSTTIFLVRS